jgi:hypothetical protein
MRTRHVLSKSGQPSVRSLYKYASWIWLIVVMLSLVAFVLSRGNGSVLATSIAPSTTRTVWLQVLDSCQQAIPGSSFKITGAAFNVEKGPAPGQRPHTVTPVMGKCPLERGDCARVPTGCLSWDIPIPAQGTATYQIVETAAAQNYVPCTGGSVCSGGPLTGTLTIDATGAVTATIKNTYPDRAVVTWPTSGSPYTGTQTDPITVHNFGLGNISCDGDNDADDHLTGTPGSHCDSDGDRVKAPGPKPTPKPGPQSTPTPAPKP